MTDLPNYPGSEMFTKAMEHFRANAEEFTRHFTEMKLPAMPGTDIWVAAHKRNVEALTAANKVALEGAQTVAKRHLEIIQETIAELTDSMKSLTTSEPPREKAAKQAELLKLTYERALARTKELGEMIQATNSEAVKLLNHRFVEAIEEVKSAASPAA